MRRPFLLLVTLLLLIAPAVAEACKVSKVPKGEFRRYDAKATLP
jgi:hypothetical protein